MSLDVTLTAIRRTPVFEYNITHNLNTMADKADIYEALWRPNEIGLTQANQIIDKLEIGLMTLRQNPEYFKLFNPKNGWGDYEGLVKFVEEYLKACKENPDAEISTWR